MNGIFAGSGRDRRTIGRPKDRHVYKISGDQSVYLLLIVSSEVIEEPLPLKPRILVKRSVVLVKRKNGFTKTTPWTENPGKMRRRAF